MLKRVYGVVAAVSVIQLLLLLAIAGYLAASGKLSRQRMGELADMWQGPAGNGEQTSPSPTTRPNGEPTGSMPPPRTANKRLTKILDDEQKLLIRYDRARREIRNQKESLDRKLLDALAKIEELQDKIRTLQQVQQVTPDEVEKRFRENLKLLENVDPGQAKNLLLATPKPLAVKYVRALLQSKPRKLQAISEEFETPEEVAVYEDWWKAMNQVSSNATDRSPQPATRPGAEQ